MDPLDRAAGLDIMPYLFRRRDGEAPGTAEEQGPSQHRFVVALETFSKLVLLVICFYAASRRVFSTRAQDTAPDAEGQCPG
ncbi:hypothetical protein PsYK624_163380 [Phanerochaete sordida]|uniref:Uncharacterized protein n=1 Tax=Phanerochaete sordida TaxID=48140 RepID=A0A9P3LM53_9APHY|nr:hypothetical protein PsYK624_163380 [Phanerochaete sordida]